MEAWGEEEVPGINNRNIYQAGVKSQGKCGHVWGLRVSMRRRPGCRVGMCRRLLSSRVVAELRET